MGLKLGSIALLLLLVSECATNVVVEKPLPKVPLTIDKLTVETDPHSNATQAHSDALLSAMKKELSSIKGNRAKVVDLRLVIIRASFVSQGTRALSGMLAGANHFDVRSFITVPGEAAPLGTFTVKVENNPGGLGAFSDPVKAAARDAVKAIIDKVITR